MNHPLPSHILKLMDPEQRPSGPGGLTKEEAIAVGEVKLEVDHLHNPFRAWCHFHGLYYIYHRPDRKSGIRKGHPDFTVLGNSRAVCVEFKRPGGKLSKDQEECKKEIEASGTPYALSFDVNHAIHFVKESLDFHP